MNTAFAIATSALDSSQTALNVIGQNVSNATTAGYHDESVDLGTTVSGSTGTGVDVASITRYTDDPVENALNTATTDQNATNAQLAANQQIQTALNTGTGGIDDQLNSFFNQVDALTSDPSSTPDRQQLIATAGTLTGQLNSAASSLGQLSSNTATSVSQNITQVNTLAAQIASLNTKISASEAAGQQPNDLLDQRATAISSLSGLMNVTEVNQPNGVINLIGAGAGIVVGSSAATLQVSGNASGQLVVSATNPAQTVTISSGTIGGELQAYNTAIPTATSQLNTFTNQLVQSVNEVQATGLGLNGPQTSATGSVAASSATATLNNAGLPFTVQSGQLTVSVTDSSGNRTNTTININPATDTLQSVATALNGVTGLQASVNSSNQLQITAQSGYSFDFAGRDTVPATNAAVSNPDTSGILSALGINGFFTGSDASSIAVNPALVSDPTQLAASTTGEPGDGTNLQRLSAVQDQPLINGETLTQNYTSQSTSVGSTITSLTDQQTAQTSVVTNLTNQDQSQTGVDTNQEFVNLLSYQKMLQGASEYFTTVNSAYQSLLTMIQR